MKKKRLCLVLCACMILSTWGCNNKEPQKQSSGEETETNTQTEENLSPTDEENPEPFVPDISPERLAEEKKYDNCFDLYSCNWNSTTFQLDAENYRLPFSYARISDEWTFSLEDYGYDETFSLQPGERTTATVELTHPTFDYTMVVGFYNPYDVPITIEESKIWSISIDLSESTSTYLPYLPQGITKGSKLGDVILAYGNPTTPFIHDFENNTFIYQYFMDYNKFVTLVIHETKGVIKLTVQNYGLSE